MCDNDVVLSYHSVLLRRRDVDLLECDWLNDMCIAFVFEYFEQERYTDNLAFVGPETTFLMGLMESAEELEAILEPLLLRSKKRIFLAINDHSSTTAAGGTHWALLAYEAETRAFFYFDSMGSYAIEAARRVHQKLARVLRVEDSSTFQLCATPRQQNGRDCGVYVLAITRALCQSGDVPIGDVSLSNVTPANVTEMRGQIRKLIEQRK